MFHFVPAHCLVMDPQVQEKWQKHTRVTRGEKAVKKGKLLKPREVAASNKELHQDREKPMTTGYDRSGTRETHGRSQWMSNLRTI